MYVHVSRRESVVPRIVWLPFWKVIRCSSFAVEKQRRVLDGAILHTRPLIANQIVTFCIGFPGASRAHLLSSIEIIISPAGEDKRALDRALSGVYHVPEINVIRILCD